MGNCGLKPKVLIGAPPPEELQISLLEDQKVDASKSLSNLFLLDKAEKKIQDEEEEKTTPENIPVHEDLKTALPEAKSPTKEIKSPTTETEPLVTETQSPVRDTNAPSDDQKVRNEKTVREDKVINDATVEETETEAKLEEVRSEAAAP